MSPEESPQELSREEEDMYNLSDEELERAYRESRRESIEPTDVAQEETAEEETTEEEANEESSEQSTDENVQDDSSEEQNDNDEEEESAEELSNEQSKATSTESSRHKIKTNGMEVELSVEELKMLAPKAMDYTKKMQEIAPYRRSIEAMKQNGISEEDINLLIEAKSGKKEALARLIKQAGVDALDIEDDKPEYRPNTYGNDDSELELRNIVSKIANDQEFNMTKDIVDRQWDDKSRAVLKQRPEMIEGLHYDVKNGIYAVVAPMALKMKALDGARKSDLEYYMLAGQEYTKSQQRVQGTIQKEEARKQNQASIAQKADIRKAAALPPKGKAGKPNVIDYLNDNDEKYDEWYKNVMSKY